MRLSTRLLLIVLGCLVPMIAAQIYAQAELHEQREQQLRAVALRQAELANSDIASIAEGARQLGAAVGMLPEVQSRSPECNDQLAGLARRVSSYLFLAVVDQAGNIVCTSAPLLAKVDAGWAVKLIREPGEYATAPGIEAPFLPISIPMGNPGTLVLGLDLGWLARHLQDPERERTVLLPNADLLVADRRGVVLARLPEQDGWTGHELPPELRKLLGGSRPVTQVMTDPQGRRQLAAVVPTGLSLPGLATVEIISMTDVMEQGSEALHRSTLLTAAAALMALVLAWFLGQRFIARPAERLIAAAETLGRGDLQVRVDADGPGELAAVARSFNIMAENLAARERTRALEAELLQAQLAQRTRELSENNNRLQVEIAEREKTEASLTHAQKLQAVGQLAGGIAHDFNNMLATVLGSLELMERRVGQSPQTWTEKDVERLRTLIQRATGAVQRGAQLTSGLLAFSRRQRVAAKPTDLNRLIDDLVTLATSTLGRRIKLTTELSEAPWPALVDPSQVEAALLNLCLNARDAMPDGGTLTIRTSNVTISAGGLGDDLPPGRYVCISVADTGSGMTPEVQRRAFDPFFTTKGTAGSGLGLSQVHQMVRQAGGSVRIRSAPGQGTEVTLLLPRAAAEAAPEDAPRTPVADRRGLPSVTVLVVDDDLAVRQVTVEMLRDLGCEVMQAGSGGEALLMIGNLSTPPDVILLDYAMPGMNGLTLARRLRQDGMAVPIALVTGYAELNELEGGETPLDGLLRKPFTIEELQSMLMRLGGLNRLASNVVRLHVPHRR
jgi:signal transduction histidine kinase